MDADLESASQLVNPFARPVGPAAIVIFGAAGDLTKRKLIPALCNLASENLLAPEFAILGVGRTALDTTAYRKLVAEDIQKYATHELDPAVVNSLLERVYYLAADFKDPDGYERIKTQLADLDVKHGTAGNHLYYLSTAPEYFAGIAEQLGAVER